MTATRRTLTKESLMRKPISTKTHGLLDFLTAGAMLALPQLLPSNHAMKTALTALGVQKLTYGLMTRHEFGLFKLIPMRYHLALDAVSGATLAALPFLLEEDDEATTAACLTLGIFDIAAAPLTQP